MALDANTIRKWAAGATTKSRNADDVDDGSDPVLEDDELDPESGAEQNAAWAGQLPPGEEIDPMAAQEMIGWLQENEPEIADAVNELAEAVSSEMPDPRMLEHARQELQTVTQYLVPEYPEFTPEQRAGVEKAITQEMGTAGFPMSGSPEFQTAIAMGLAKARAPVAEVEVEEEAELVVPGKPAAKKPPPFGAKKPMAKGPPGKPMAKPVAKGPPKAPPFGAKKPSPFAKKGPPMAKGV